MHLLLPKEKGEGGGIAGNNATHTLEKHITI
jgi:hypothetical protein